MDMRSVKKRRFSYSESLARPVLVYSACPAADLANAFGSSLPASRPVSSISSCGERTYAFLYRFGQSVKFLTQPGAIFEEFVFAGTVSTGDQQRVVANQSNLAYTLR
jgi:hypothetical protein